MGGRAKFLFRPLDEDSLVAVTSRAREESLPVRVLGAGANVLISDNGVDGVVVLLDQPEFNRWTVHGHEVRAGGGVDLMKLVRRLSHLGLAGIECMAGIPASVGGAIRMNAGGKFGEFGDIVHSATLLDPESGERRVWSRDELGFGYRRSNVGRNIVLSARLHLSLDDPETTRNRYQEIWDYKLSTQPMKNQSAGCIFKNPEGAAAGALIDRAGLKGLRHGAARVSEQHANFIVTDAGACASDVMGLIDVVRDRVQRAFGTTLETEVDIW